MTGFRLAYQPAGPTLQRFHESDAFIRGLMGPFGSAKSSASCVDVFMRAVRQPPSPVDGVRYWKHCFIRDTYRNLDLTVIPTWLTWFPKGIGEWSSGPPAQHVIQVGLRDGTRVHLTVDFIALGDNRIEDVMRGYEMGSAAIDEADRVSRDVADYVAGRLGRYPSMQHGGAYWFGLWLTFNAPDMENYLYDLLVENPPTVAQFREILGGESDVVAFLETLPALVEFFEQPSGFAADAENVHNLPPGYYARLAIGKADWWVRRFIRNQWGYSREGLPVFPEFNDQLHVASHDLDPVDALPLIIGVDAGGSPAAAIRQHMANGQWRTIDEIATPQGTGPSRFAEYLMQLLEERYPDHLKAYQARQSSFGEKAIQGWCDPSAAFGGDKDAGDLAWMDTVNAKTGLRFRPTETNRLSPRLEAVRVPMTRLIDGHIPGYQLSPRCRVLRKAYNAGYRYKRVNLVGVEQYRDEPEKNDYSHPADADQYAALGGGELYEITGRQQARHSPAAGQTRAISDDSPTGGWADARDRNGFLQRRIVE